MRTALVWGLAVLLGACSANAPTANKIQVGDAWLGASSGMTDSAAIMATPTTSMGTEQIAPAAFPIFMTIRNQGSQNDRLVQAETAIAPRVELHNFENRDGQMMMVPVAGIDIPPGEVKLQRGSYHIMVFGPTSALKVGDVFSLTLKFEKAGTLQTQVTVRQQ
ncbi:MAG: copper chaperone PCu(A)C [Chloroflexota bacterium]|nr:copper chaperone PCu(A)C [Chloroflexota bacterium]